MKRVLLPVAGILFLEVAVFAQEEAEYQKYQNWMQTIRTTVGSLNQNLETKSGDAVAADAKKLAEIFGEVHDFWHGKNISDAMQFAMDAQSGFTEAAQLASQDKIEEASEAVTKARTTCGGCHSAHRERGEDGSWRIKY